jgi:hypothetical protein
MSVFPIYPPLPWGNDIDDLTQLESWHPRIRIVSRASFTLFFNIFFHAGATAAFGAYCPGLLTALTVYPSLFYFISRLAFSEGLLTNRLGWISFVIAGVVHAADVSRNVFKAW